MSKHSKVIEFGSKANADNYGEAGWELIETRAGRNFTKLKKILTRASFALTIETSVVIVSLFHD